MRTLPLMLSCGLAMLTACTSGGDDPETDPDTDMGGSPEPGAGGDEGAAPDDETPAAPPEVQAPGTIQLNFLYVHGVQSEASGRMRAERSLTDLQAAVNAELPALIAAYQASHPGVVVTTASGRANLYTATPSGVHPSDSNDPLLMDDWEVGDPGCTTTRQGDPCTTAYEWRFRLVQEIKRVFPPTAKNIILVGHSTGARTAFEVTSNTGPGGVGTFDWGVKDRIAAVVSINGMIDGLQSDKYNVIGPLDFVATCKNTDLLLGLFGGATPGNGWCEYAGNVSGVPAADWVGQNKRSRVLISAGSCSPSLWNHASDSALPLAAEGSPFSVGLNMTPEDGDKVTVAFGRNYGSFCHSTITSGGDPDHAAAVASAKTNVLDLVFTAATRVDQQGTVSTAGAIGFRATTPSFALGGACPAGDTGIDPQLQVVGGCQHPGFFDGDDHAIVDGFSVDKGNACNGGFRWSQVHDPDNSHAAQFWWQTRSNPTGGGLLSLLKPE